MDKTCKWVEDKDGDFWTDCDDLFICGTPKKPTKFCCYCGGKLEQVDYKEGEGDDDEKIHA